MSIKQIKKISLLTFIIGFSFVITNCEQKTIFVVPNPSLTSTGYIDINIPNDRLSNAKGSVSFAWNTVLGTGVTYNLYLDEKDATTQYATGIKAPNIILNELKSNRTYYWKVVANVPNGISIESKVRTFSTMNSTISTPSLTSPSTNATNLPGTVALLWEPSTSSDGANIVYDIYLDYSPNPSIKAASNISGSIYTATNLVTNKVYYWKVVAKNASQFISENNEVRKFTTGNYTINTTVSTPQILSPENGATNQQSTVALSWTPVLSPDNSAIVYDVYIDRISVPKIKVISGLTAPYYTATSLQTGNIQFYWKVVARNTNNVSFESEIRSFTTYPIISSMSLSSPVNNATQQPVNSTLSWTAPTSSDNSTITYDVYVDQNSSPTNIIAQNLIINSYTTINLPPTTRLYWKVVAKSNTAKQSETSVFSFTTYVASPNGTVAIAQPTLVAPVNYTINAPLTSTTLQWNPVTGTGILYDVYIDNNTSPITRIANGITATSYTPTLVRGNTYFWKIVARDNFGNQSQASPIYKFSTPPIIDAPTLILPSGGSTVSGSSVTMSWNRVVGNGIKYNVYIGTVPNPTTPIANDLTTTTTQTTLSLSNTTYYWKIIAYDSDGNTSTSIVSYFNSVP